MWMSSLKRHAQQLLPASLPLCVAALVVTLLSGPAFGGQLSRRKTLSAGGPCYAKSRCALLVKIMQARDAQQVRQFYSEGCHGYPESALSALRLYELKVPGSESKLLNSMPRSLGDFMALTWMLTDGTAESATDVAYFWEALPPDDELPTAPPDGAPTIARKYFYSYFSSLADSVATHPEYLPRFMIISQFYGHKKEDSYLMEYFRDNTGVNMEVFFRELLLKLYRANPRTFEESAQWSRLGEAALKEVLASKGVQKTER
jgi:hypothetical protein